jgi:hypothetical protein
MTTSSEHRTFKPIGIPLGTLMQKAHPHPVQFSSTHLAASNEVKAQEHSNQGVQPTNKKRGRQPLLPHLRLQQSDPRANANYLSSPTNPRLRPAKHADTSSMPFAWIHTHTQYIQKHKQTVILCLGGIIPMSQITQHNFRSSVCYNPRGGL